MEKSCRTCKHAHGTPSWGGTEELRCCCPIVTQLLNCGNEIILNADRASEFCCNYWV